MASRPPASALSILAWTIFPLSTVPHIVPQAHRVYCFRHARSEARSPYQGSAFRKIGEKGAPAARERGGRGELASRADLDHRGAADGVILHPDQRSRAGHPEGKTSRTAWGRRILRR